VVRKNGSEWDCEANEEGAVGPIILNFAAFLIRYQKGYVKEVFPKKRQSDVFQVKEQ
jgi:hypothetical protein